MQIRNEHIKVKKIVGLRKNGTPIFFLETHGGLNAVIGNDNGQIVAMGAAPHKAIATWMAEKKYPDIQWNRDALWGDD
jgi:hypothetical protein